MFIWYLGILSLILFSKFFITCPNFFIFYSKLSPSSCFIEIANKQYNLMTYLILQKIPSLVFKIIIKITDCYKIEFV